MPGNPPLSGSKNRQIRQNGGPVAEVGLEASGFRVESLRVTIEAARDFAARSRAIVQAGGKPPHRAVILALGERAPEAMANSGRAAKEGRTVPIELLCRKVRV